MTDPQVAAAFTICFDGAHHQQDRDLLCADPIPVKVTQAPTPRQGRERPGGIVPADQAPRVSWGRAEGYVRRALAPGVPLTLVQIVEEVGGHYSAVSMALVRMRQAGTVQVATMTITGKRAVGVYQLT
jgi:hypothetical protein